LAPGDNPNKERLFEILGSFSPGSYDARWVIYEQGNPGNVYDTVTVLNAIEIVDTQSSNQTPICGGVSKSTPSNIPVEFDINDHCSDPDNDSISLSFVGNATNGTIEQLTSTTIRFTATSGFEGFATFQIKVTDGELETSLITWGVNVNAPEGPTAAISSITNFGFIGNLASFSGVGLDASGNAVSESSISARIPRYGFKLHRAIDKVGHPHHHAECFI